MKQLIGVDVGGSSVKLGAVTGAGERLAEVSVAVEAGASAREILGTVGARARELAGGAPRGIGVGLPGLLDREAGTIRNSPNLPWLEGVDVRALLARASGAERESILLENDANVAALGELWLGAARGARHLILLTLGTGIGGGIVLDGRLYRGEGLAGEIGHLTVDPDGPPCGCGSHGCLETLASASATQRRARELGLPAEAPGDLRLLADRARETDGPERALLFAVGRDLGHGCGSALCLLDVRTFVFGGGFSAALDLLEPGIRRGLSEWAYGERVAGVRIERATLGPSAGWIGAARLLVPVDVL